MFPGGPPVGPVGPGVGAAPGPGKAPAPGKAPGKAAPPVRPPNSDEYSNVTCAAILHGLQINVRAPDVPVNKLTWRTTIRSTLNVTQWRNKLQVVYGMSAEASTLYGTRDEACAEAFWRSPFA